MIAPRAGERFSWLAALLLAAATSAQAAPTLALQLEQAARAALERQSAGLAEPQFEIALVTNRATPPCAQALAIEPVDTRTPARMRFAVRCLDAGGWRYEYVLRARVTAVVAVTAAPVAANQLIGDADITMERRDISAVSDSIGAPEAVVGQSSRRTLRAGEVLRQSQLAAPILVKRGDQVLMVAHRELVEVSTSGEALDAGARGATVRVRNSANGQVVRMRVTGAGTVEPVDLPAISP